jgi:hypothetical protein
MKYLWGLYNNEFITYMCQWFCVDQKGRRLSPWYSVYPVGRMDPESSLIVHVCAGSNAGCTIVIQCLAPVLAPGEFVVVLSTLCNFAVTGR